VRLLWLLRFVFFHRKIQANNQAIEQETQAEETAKQAIQKEQEKQAKTSNEIKQRQAENEAAIKEKIETEKSLKKLQNTQRSHKPAKKATKEEDQIAKNILAAKVNEARKLDGEKKRIVKATADALTTANQQLQETIVFMLSYLSACFTHVVGCFV
jgi:cysteinyl-tRNA synthetase